MRNVNDDQQESDKKYSIVNVSICNVNPDSPTAIVFVGRIPICTLIDSGCSKNIIDEQTWRMMRSQGVEVKNTRLEVDKQFSGYGQVPLRQLIAFDAVVKTKEGQEFVETFYVIENGTQPLLRKETLEKLGILEIHLPSHEGIVPVNQVTKTSRQSFPKIRGIEIHLPVRPEVPPVKQPLRRIPAALARMVKEKLDELEQSDIIERVTEPSPWISALIPIFKDNGELRLCVDMRRVNEAILREHHPLPVFDESFPYLTKAKYFTVLDIKQAYHQCELDVESRALTTFMTQWGRYRYKRLVFGVNCAPEIFQRTMESMLSHCQNVIVFIDDLLIYGATENEHDLCLTKVMTVLKDQDVLHNSQKCRIKMKEVKFLGHILSAEGIRPTEDKIQAIKSFKAPNSKEELRSLLGLINYVGKFMPDLATLTDCLRQLIKKEAKFEWLDEHGKALQKIVSIMSNCKTLFDAKEKTRLVTDASPFGLGAVLIQETSEVERDISYAAKSLSETEKRYCTTEKEALAVVWGVEKFKMYLLGLKFELETDHKALENIFKPASQPCARKVASSPAGF